MEKNTFLKEYFTGLDTRNITEPLLNTLDKVALVAVTDAAGTIVFANDLFVEISKFPREELLGQNHRILKSGHHPQSFYDDMWRTISGGDIWRGQIKNKTKDDSFYWVDSVISPITTHDGWISHYIAVRFPITQLKELESALQQKADELSKMVEAMKEKTVVLENAQKAMVNLLEDLGEEKKEVEQKVAERTNDLEREKNKLLQVTEHMKGGGILLDTDCTVVFTNDALCTLLGMEVCADPPSVMEHFFAYFAGSDVRSDFKRCVAGESFHVPEVEGKDGRISEIFFHALENVREGVHDPTGYFILIIDITDAKLLERSKSELVAVASHQLRTPLTAMRGNVEMLIDESYGALNKEQRELLDDVEMSTQRLIGMVNDMLDITKIEGGNLDMTVEEFNAQEIFDSVLADLKDYAERHEFSIVCTVPESTPTVYADKVRVRQIFQNLIDNAIKYSRHPGMLRISCVSTDSHVEIAFKDNGIGVPKNEQQKLFGRFYRASNTASTTSSGSGLGLYIVKSISQQLGGDIRFESEENVGTTFYVTLPTQRAAHATV